MNYRQEKQTPLSAKARMSPGFSLYSDKSQDQDSGTLAKSSVPRSKTPKHHHELAQLNSELGSLLFRTLEFKTGSTQEIISNIEAVNEIVNKVKKLESSNSVLVSDRAFERKRNVKLEQKVNEKSEEAQYYKSRLEAALANEENKKVHAASDLKRMTEELKNLKEENKKILKKEEIMRKMVAQKQAQINAMNNKQGNSRIKGNVGGENINSLANVQVKKFNQEVLKDLQDKIQSVYQLKIADLEGENTRLKKFVEDLLNKVNVAMSRSKIDTVVFFGDYSKDEILEQGIQKLVIREYSNISYSPTICADILLSLDNCFATLASKAKLDANALTKCKLCEGYKTQVKALNYVVEEITPFMENLVQLTENEQNKMRPTRVKLSEMEFDDASSDQRAILLARLIQQETLRVEAIIEAEEKRDFQIINSQSTDVDYFLNEVAKALKQMEISTSIANLSEMQ